MCGALARLVSLRRYRSGPISKLIKLEQPQWIRKSHTILLVQPNSRPDTRTYSDYDTMNECLEGVCKIYEEHLKRVNPDCPSITYDITQLFEFIDQLTDLSCLVFQKSDGKYVPHNKDWLKEKIYIMLRKQAGK